MTGNYPGGVPNPKEHGWISLTGPSASDLECSEEIGAVCKLLGREPLVKEADGAENEIIAAAIETSRALSPPVKKFAWVEARSKKVGEYWDVAFTLTGRIDGKTVIHWQIETYNPYFGCSIHHLEWRGETLFIIYTEKHLTLCGCIGASGEVRLRAVDHQWALVNDYVFHAGEHDSGLVEIIEGPTLERRQPAPASLLADCIGAFAPLPEIKDRHSFIARLKNDIFNFDAGELESDLLIGSLLYPFWLSWPPVTGRYEIARRWNPPLWLPFYWHMSLDDGARRPFIALLERLIASPILSEDPYVVHAGVYLQERCKITLDACRNGKLPEKKRCYFWVDWSIKAFELQLADFPAGFVQAHQHLKRRKGKWAAIGDNR